LFPVVYFLKCVVTEVVLSSQNTVFCNKTCIYAYGHENRVIGTFLLSKK